jgi:cell division protein FtsQ
MAQGATRKRSRRDQVKQLPVRGIARVLRALLGASLALTVGAAVLAGAWQALQIPVERVMISGDLREVSRERLTESVNRSLQGGFLSVNIQQIRASVESLPWVYRANIKRRWPNRLEIQVVEQLPIARWGDDGYLNHAGELFAPGQMIVDAELPRLAGPSGSEAELMRHYKQIQDDLQPLDLQVEQLSMDSRGSLRAQLTGGSELVFGHGDISGKLQRFARVFQAQLAPRVAQLRSIDLRYSHGVAVAWSEPAVAGNQKT